MLPAVPNNLQDPWEGSFSDKGISDTSGSAPNGTYGDKPSIHPSVYIVEDGVDGSKGLLNDPKQRRSHHMALTAASAAAGNSAVDVKSFDIANEAELSTSELKQLIGLLKHGDAVNISSSKNIEISSLRAIAGLEHVTAENLKVNSDQIITALQREVKDKKDTDKTALVGEDKLGKRKLEVREVKEILNTIENIEQIARQGNKVYIAAGNTSDSMHVNMIGIVHSDVRQNVIVVGSTATYSTTNSNVDLYKPGDGEVIWQSDGTPAWSFNGATIKLSESAEYPTYKVSDVSPEHLAKLKELSEYAQVQDKNWERNLAEHLNRYGQKIALPAGTYRIADILTSLPKDELEKLKSVNCELTTFDGKQFSLLLPVAKVGTSFSSPYFAAQNISR